MIPEEGIITPAALTLLVLPRLFGRIFSWSYILRILFVLVLRGVILLSPWSKVLLQKLIFAHLAKKLCFL
jgi:hypothetical protein